MTVAIVDYGSGNLHSAAKAFELISLNREAVKTQLEAWPYRNVSPQNRAGWIIEAIEKNYNVPLDFLQDNFGGHVLRDLGDFLLCAGADFKLLSDRGDYLN